MTTSARDDAVFRAMFEQYAPRVRRFVRDLARDDGFADEATQETFVRAHGAFDRLRDRDRVGAWLLGIARNVYLERYRRERRHTRHLRALRAHEAAQGAAAPSPERVLLRREADQLLAGALDSLSTQRRAALVLRIDHGLSYRQISRQLGWSLSKVKNEIHRARVTLRAHLGGYAVAGVDVPLLQGHGQGAAL